MNVLFDQAVAIVQSLPKAGPIQTDYEDKLEMYSLYKQATAGNVSSSRPAMWDMLGRAKWDAWAKHGNMSSEEAKARYVESLRKVLRKYSDAEGSKELLKQLQTGQPGEVNDLQHEAASDSGSSNSDEEVPPGGFESTSDFVHATVPPTTVLPYPSHLQHSSHSGMKSVSDPSSSDAEPDRPPPAPSRRAQSINSSQQRYRTPIGTTSPLPLPAVNVAYSEPNRVVFQPSTALSVPGSFAADAPPHLATNAVAGPSLLQDPSQMHRNPSRGHSAFHHRSQSTITPAAHGVERVLYSIQGHLAALTERLDRLEDTVATRRASGPVENRKEEDKPIDLSHMGLWSLILTPLSRLASSLSGLLQFLFGRKYSKVPHPSASGPNPILVIIRRLLLDASFILAAYALFRLLRRRSSGRRREIQVALRGLWTAMMGKADTRVLTSRGV